MRLKSQTAGTCAGWVSLLRVHVALRHAFAGYMYMTICTGLRILAAVKVGHHAGGPRAGDSPLDLSKANHSLPSELDLKLGLWLGLGRGLGSESELGLGLGLGLGLDAWMASSMVDA